MAYFAQLEFEMVRQVICIADNNCSGGVLPQADISGASFIAQLGIAGVWVLTGVDDPIRKNFAFIGCDFDAVRDAFIAPKPFASWVLDEATCRWIAPVPMPVPNNPPLYVWDEATVSWIAAQ